eukprot:TRINITY_DN3936_c0_g1_i1.p1 TRINITY_DN3936_c0_g1~~TRINITY_DN3936_c0_g1_i1.p1  ORF type:complete len:278 (-),score=33.76 TRINITY_DN3936_c0_g1_i1:57-890(-)
MAEYLDPPAKRRKIEIEEEENEDVDAPDPPAPQVRLLAGVTYDGPPGFGNALESRFSNITCLAADADGAIYFADRNVTAAVICLLKDGTVSKYAGADNGGLETDAIVRPLSDVRFGWPKSFLIGPNGTKYLSDFINDNIYAIVGNNIFSIAGSEPHDQPTATEPAPAPWGFQKPTRMAMTRNGSIFVLEASYPPRIRKVENGVISYVADPSYPGWPGPSYQPQVIVASHDDSRLLFSDSGDHSIWQLPLAGGPITRVETYLPPGSSANLEFVCDAGA